jgi:dimethylamine monooxygenase subunit A
MAYTYRPYATDGVVPFRIGLALLDPKRWIEPDEKLASELSIKSRLLQDAYADVVMAEPDTHASQIEVRNALVAFLLESHPAIYRTHGRSIDVETVGPVHLDDDLPLVAAARLIQDDLCLMRRGPDGWRLAAAVLTAPSAWSLAEKFGRPMREIHEPVPGYAETMAAKIDRIFDHLNRDKPVWRLNWSIYDDDLLYHPETKRRERRWTGDGGSFGTQAFIRVERQTLCKMPVSGDILFTIRVYVDPIAAFKTHPDGPHLARGLAERLSGLDMAQLRYKSLLADRTRILTELNAIARALD